jgi:hypothetical protein
MLLFIALTFKSASMLARELEIVRRDYSDSRSLEKPGAIGERANAKKQKLTTQTILLTLIFEGLLGMELPHIARPNISFSTAINSCLAIHISDQHAEKTKDHWLGTSKKAGARKVNLLEGDFIFNNFR